METEEKELSPQESLQLIHNMINKTKDSVADDSFYFLLWGWLVFTCCAASFCLKVFFHYDNFYYIWLLMPVGGIVSGIYGSRQAKKQKVKTFVEEYLNYLWIAIGCSFVVLILMQFVNGTAWQTSSAYYILLYAIGTFVSGKALRFKPLVIGGLINLVLAVVILKFNYDYQLLINSLAILTSYIIPGHLLRIRHQKQKIKS
jgi:hypothetical protein